MPCVSFDRVSDFKDIEDGPRFAGQQSVRQMPSGGAW